MSARHKDEVARRRLEALIAAATTTRLAASLVVVSTHGAHGIMLLVAARYTCMQACCMHCCSWRSQQLQCTWNSHKATSSSVRTDVLTLLFNVCTQSTQGMDTCSSNRQALDAC